MHVAAKPTPNPSIKRSANGRPEPEGPDWRPRASPHGVTFMVSQRDLFNACLHTFIDRNYEASLELAQHLGQEESFLPFPIWMVLLLSAQHIGHTKLINNMGDQVLHASKSKPWEHEVVTFSWTPNSLSSRSFLG